ncbi:MAG: hypothetical protein HAW58_04300, partial [Candidatus Thioglobus sp.]|nr:hypothetical protein [Candidatus Thioglobus sp.]
GGFISDKIGRKLTSSADTVDHRGTRELTVRVTPAGATNPAVTWSRIRGSSQIASINGSTLTGVRPGSVRIRATAVDDSSITAEQDIRVVGFPVTSVKITSSNTITDGEFQTLTAEVKPDNASTPAITWSIESKIDGGDADILNTGNTFAASSPGRVTVRATAYNGKTDTQEIRISQIDVTAVSITSAATAFINTNLNLTHTTEPNIVSDSSVSWTIVTKGSTGATITGNTFRATAAGTAQIRATSVSNSNISATQDITISDIPVTSITITSANHTPDGVNLQLTANVEPPEAAASIVWSVENYNNDGGDVSIASINGSTLHALSHGNIIILASGVGANGAITAEQNFSIDAIRVSGITITSIASVINGQGSQVTLAATTAPDNASTPGVTWSVIAGSGNASISNGNVLRGTSVGTATVVATAIDGSGTTAEQLFTIVDTPVAPASISAVATGTANEITLFWPASAGATGYALYQSTTDTGTTTFSQAATITGGENLSHNITLAVGTTSAEGIAYFKVAATYGANNGLASGVSAATASAPLNDFVFKTVNGADNRVWMDRNLDASQVATALNDAESYGGYYQFGRPADGHQASDSTVITTQSTTRFPEHGDFIHSTSNWLVGNGINYDDLKEFYQKTDGSSVCPTGFRGALAAEWTTESNSWTSFSANTINAAHTAFASNLKLPAGGYRDGTNAAAELVEVGEIGQYIIPLTEQTFGFGGGVGLGSSGNYVLGRTVRCIRDADLTVLPLTDFVKITAIADSTDTLADGGTLELAVATTPANATNKTIIWSITSGGNFATLFNNTLTATAPGTVVLSGLSNDGSNITTAKTVTITKVDVASVAITTSPSINVGATVNLAATVLPTNASNPALTWAISGGNNVASINGNTLHGLTVGTVNIIATADGVASDSTEFSIEPAPVETITITSAAEVTTASSLQLTATVAPNHATLQTLAWSIENGDNSIASIDTSVTPNVLHGIAVGTVKVIAKATDGSNVMDEQNFTVIARSLAITSAAEAVIGSTVNLTATTLPAVATITWATVSGNNDIISISGDVLTAVAVGVESISATIDGANNTQEFKVKPLAPATLQAAANGVRNQVTVFWSAVAGATGYKLYQSTADLSALAGGNAGNLSAVSPTTIETTEVGVNLNLDGADKNYFLVTATVNMVESNTNSQQAVAVATSQEFGTITGQANSVWMDRNLGAARVATGADDSESFGGYYQWGRPTDGHQLKTSAYNTNLGTQGNISPASANFARTFSGTNNDWLSGDDNGARRQAFWSKIDGSGVCPTGFRVPTQAELQAEYDSYGGTKWQSAFASLKLPRNGGRNSNGNSPGNGPHDRGNYWSSTPHASDRSSFRMTAAGGFGGVNGEKRAFGLGVRCIRDSSTVPTVPAAQPIPVSPATLQAAATGTANQVTVFWSAVSDASGYKVYQSADDLSAFAGGIPPTAATITETTELGINITLAGADKNYFLVTAVNAAGESPTNAAQAIAVANSQVFETVTGENNRVWMDRNLGAAQVATATDDADAYGDYYQWGRPKDGHQLISSSTTTNKSTSLTPGHSDFVADGRWLRNDVDANGSLRQEIWSRIDGSGVCPTGFRVPTQVEIEAESVTWTESGHHRDNAFDSALKLATAGRREGSAAGNTGNGYYWSSDAGTADHRGKALFLGGGSTVNDQNTGNGFTIRCIRDASIAAVPVQTPATLQAVANGTQNQATVFWSAVADASGYKLYQSADDLSAFAGGTPPTAATIIETTEGTFLIQEIF